MRGEEGGSKARWTIISPVKQNGLTGSQVGDRQVVT